MTKLIDHKTQPGPDFHVFQTLARPIFRTHQKKKADEILTGLLPI
jgi:hypothetical protein